jgi:putative polyhydroxyalkanoate system protein
MPSIEISRKHTRSLKEARIAIEHVAEKLAEKFAVEYEWRGNTLHFERMGVNGNIQLGRGKVDILVQLGFLLMALRGPIETEIHRYIDKELGPEE